MALGLALQGLEQIDIKIDEERRESRPTNLSQMIEMELATGNSFNRLNSQNYFYDDQPEEETYNPLDSLYSQFS